MSNSLCPHLVQEYFERVSEILQTYRPQILAQVEYDRISENLVLRGAIRQEEHLKILQCALLEGQVSQMLVVLQNRMWGLENLLAACMEEHVSSWLSQELFRAYMEHLVLPLRKLRENPKCQCLQQPTSVLYRGWVKALKSLDSLILKTGTTLGFVKQSMYPSDNMLQFLSNKLAEYTGGDSCSSMTSGEDDTMVAYGFAPGASGEVQVAELEEDDINDLFSFGENTLSIDYHQHSYGNYDKPITAERPVIGKPVQRKLTNKRRGSGVMKERNNSENETTVLSEHQQPPPPQSKEVQDKLAKQRELIARLSAPKNFKNAQSVAISTKQRSTRPAELNKSVPTSPSATTTGKTQGFVRSKSYASPTSPKSGLKGQSSSVATSEQVTRPMAIATPTVKGMTPKRTTRNTSTVTKRKGSSSSHRHSLTSADEENETASASLSEEEEDDEILSKNRKLFKEYEHIANARDEISVEDMLPEISELLLKKTILADEEEKAKNLTYYQLNFDSLSDDDNENN